MPTSFTDLSYSPQWEHHHFDKEGYKEFLGEMAAKQQGALIIRSQHTLKVAGFVERIWNQIIGWFGFEDQTNVTKVSYEFLKILRYGESHHFFEDNDIRQILANVQKNLAKDQQYARISQVINSLLSIDPKQESPSAFINHRIIAYHRENESILHESFWPRLFHTYIAPIQKNAALIQFNMGRIQLNDRDYEQAVLSFQSALKMDPDYPDCLSHLTKALLAQAELLHQKQQWVEALRIYDEALLTLKVINVKRLSSAETADINDLFVKVHLFKCATELKLDQLQEGVATLKKLSESSSTPLEYYLKHYHFLVPPTSPLFLNEFQLAAFYIRISPELPDFKMAGPYLARGIELLAEMVKIPNRHPAVYGNLVQAHLFMAKGLLAERQYELVEAHCNNGFAAFMTFQNHMTDDMRNYFVREFFNTYEFLAYNLEKEQKNLVAVRIYQQLKTMFQHDNFSKAKCCSAMARLFCAEGYYHEAWKEVQEACQLYPYEGYTQQYKDVAAKIAQKALNEQSYTDCETYWNHILALDPENIEALHGLTLMHMELKDFDKAEYTLGKAIARSPDDLRLLFLKGQLCEANGKLAEALENYRRACSMDPQNPLYKEKIIAASIQAGDKIYATGSCRVENVQQTLIDFIEFVQASSSGKKIEIALGGPSSEDMKEFLSLGQSIENADDLVYQAKRSLQLIEKAYDGRTGHPSPSEIPVQLKERMQILDQQIAQMIDHYSSLRNATLDFVSFVYNSEFYDKIEGALGSWIGSFSSENREFLSLGKDVKRLSQIEEDFTKALKLIDYAFDGQKPHLPFHEMPVELKKRMEEMRALLAPTSMTAQAAIPHYLKAYELAPNEYRDYLNRLIDSYFRINDHKQAIDWYEKLVQKFPHFPIWINPEAYLKMANVLLAMNKFIESIDLISKAIKIAPNRTLFQQALSHAYYLIAEGFLKKNNTNSALEYYHKALACGVEAEPACYASLGNYYEKQMPFAANESIKSNFLEQALQYRAKAVELAPENADFNFQYGRLLYHEDTLQRIDPVPYLEKAVMLDPNNVTYLYGLTMALRRKGAEEKIVDQYLGRFKALGGNIHNNYWEPAN